MIERLKRWWRSQDVWAAGSNEMPKEDELAEAERGAEENLKAASEQLEQTRTLLGEMEVSTRRAEGRMSDAQRRVDNEIQRRIAMARGRSR